MSRFFKKKPSSTLYKAILSLESEEECRAFLQDLCTISELRALEQRMEVAMLLDEGHIYSSILARTGGHRSQAAGLVIYSLDTHIYT